MPYRSIDQPTPGFDIDPAQLGAKVVVSATPETPSQEVRVEMLDLRLESARPLRYRIEPQGWAPHGRGFELRRDQVPTHAGPSQSRIVSQPLRDLS